MKKVLLTTTALVMTAGVAAAEVSFKGTMGVALVDDNGASALAAAALTQGDGETAEEFAARQATTRATRDGMFVASYYDFDVSMSAASDNGITASASFDMGSGELIDYNDDDVLEVQSGTIGNADVAVSYAGWTLKVDQDGIDNLFDDAKTEDLSIAGSVGGASVAYATDLENETNSYSLGFTMGDLGLTFSGTNNDPNGGDATKVALSYTMGDLKLGASMSDESVDGEDDQDVSISYKMDAITVSYKTIKPGKDADFGDEWDASIAYSAGAMSASYAVDETDASTVIAEYDLGGGATVFAAMHDKDGENSDLTTLGINFAF